MTHSKPVISGKETAHPRAHVSVPITISFDEALFVLDEITQQMTSKEMAGKFSERTALRLRVIESRIQDSLTYAKHMGVSE